MRPSTFDERWDITSRAGGADLTDLMDTVSVRQAKHGATWKTLAEQAARANGTYHIARPQSASIDAMASSNCTFGTQSVAGADTGQANAIILQHGIFSDNCTWTGVVPRLQPAMAVSRIVTTKTGSLDALNVQAQSMGNDVVALHPEANPWGPSRYRFAIVGHSQGGLVARTIAGWGQEAGFTWISGVVTLDTPNHGAVFADGFNAVNGISAMVLGYETVLTYGFFRPLAVGIATLFGKAGPLARETACQIRQLFCDLRPGSAHLTNLNAAAVTFRRTAIVQDVRRQWSGFRWLKDVLCDDEVNETTCGPRLVHRVEYLHKSFRNCTKVGAVIGAFIAPGAYALMNFCRRNRAQLETTDRVWNDAVAPGRPSDGFIGADQQWYPGVPVAQQYYYAAMTPSHAGLTRHRLTAGKICLALTERMQFQLAPLQSCPAYQ